MDINFIGKKVVPDIRTISICHGTDLRQFNKCPQYRDYVLEGCKELDLVLSLKKELPNFEKRIADGIKTQITRTRKGFIMNENIENRIFFLNSVLYNSMEVRYV